MIYLIVNLHTQERGVFKDIRDVKSYMWGRDFAEYAIYVCRRFPWVNGDIGAFERALGEVV